MEQYFGHKLEENKMNLAVYQLKNPEFGNKMAVFSQLWEINSPIFASKKLQARLYKNIV